MHSLLLRSTCALMTVTLSLQAANADFLQGSPTLPPGTPNVLPSDITSVLGINITGVQAADDFSGVLASPGDTLSLTWWGAADLLGVDSTGPNVGLLNPASSFGIGIYSDNGGEPGTLIYSTYLNSGDFNDTYLGSATVDNNSFLGLGGDYKALYEYQADFDIDVALDPGQSYWLSIVETDLLTAYLGLLDNTDVDLGPWGWLGAPGGGAYEDMTRSSGLLGLIGAYDWRPENPLGTGRAFLLQSEASEVPEPSSLACLFGIGAVFAYRRRKNQQSSTSETPATEPNTLV